MDWSTRFSYPKPAHPPPYPSKVLTLRSSLLHAIWDSASPNPKMLWERKDIEIAMYYGPKYNKTAGTWSLTLVAPG